MIVMCIKRRIMIRLFVRVAIIQRKPPMRSHRGRIILLHAPAVTTVTYTHYNSPLRHSLLQFHTFIYTAFPSLTKSIKTHHTLTVIVIISSKTMASSSFSTSHFFIKLLVLISCFNLCFATRKLTSLYQDQSQLLKYHKGPLLTGKISINLIFYGHFKPTQKAIISDFIVSLSGSSAPTAHIQPAVATWWKTIEKYYQLANSRKPSSLSLTLGKVISDEKYLLGKSLTRQQIVKLAAKGEQSNAINVVLTAADVKVEGFCMSSCGTHGSSRGAVVKGKIPRFAYIWVGNSETQCPGYCAWPFHQPPYGPQNPPLVAPNNDVGLDGMIISLGSLLAATATNPFGNGFYQGPATAPLEAASACPGIYAKGAYPGYAGDLLVDKTTGASYNAHGANGRKYVLPAIYDPKTTTCSTLV